MTSPYEPWWRHFSFNRDSAPALPWHDSYRLSGAELRAVASSIQQFQIGEWGRGRGLRRRASAHAAFSEDAWFLPALDLFIAEEQGHSRLLGKFLEHEQIPPVDKDWLDGFFRRLRKLAGLEVCISVLATAEVMAMPFYRALRDATNSPLLRAICARILRDETAHLRYQALNLASIRGRLSTLSRAIRRVLHSSLFVGTALMVWQQHRLVFRAAGWDFRRYWSDARRWFAALDRAGGPAIARSADTLQPEMSHR